MVYKYLPVYVAVYISYVRVTRQDVTRSWSCYGEVHKELRIVITWRIVERSVSRVPYYRKPDFLQYVITACVKDALRIHQPMVTVLTSKPVNHEGAFDSAIFWSFDWPRSFGMLRESPLRVS